jgi:hypothetical protein
MAAMTDTAKEWLRQQATTFALTEIEKVEGVMLKHFGTAERAQHMATLFPGRYLIATRAEGLFESVFGNTFEGHPLTGKYTLIDKLAPKPTVDIPKASTN